MAAAILWMGLLLGAIACNSESTVSEPANDASSPVVSPSPSEAVPAASPSAIPRSARPDGARVYFIDPQDGQSLASPIRVRFGLNEMDVAPAGIAKASTGHHHLVVDAPLPALDKPIPASDQYRHFGKGQTEVSLELAPGEHTLQLLLGDHSHVPHDPPVVSEPITITIE